MSIYKELVDKFGHEDRKKKCIEELAELIRAIARDDRKNVLEEMIQVLYQIEMLEVVYGLTEEELVNQGEVEYKRLEVLLDG